MRGYLHDFFIAVVFLFAYIYKELFRFLQVKYESRKRTRSRCKFSKICSDHWYTFSLVPVRLPNYRLNPAVKGSGFYFFYFPKILTKLVNNAMNILV